MVSFTPLKTPEPSPELVYSETDCQGLKVSPFPESRSISNNEKKNLSSTQVHVVQYCYLYKHVQRCTQFKYII